MKKSLFISCFVLLWARLAVSQETCSAPCDLQSEISLTSDPMSLQKPPASFWGTTGGCGFGAVTAAGATCWVDATHKWNCTIESGPSVSYTREVTYTPGPVPSGCTYPDPASTPIGQTSIHVDDGYPTVSVTYPANGAWVRREDNMTGEAQDDMQLFHAGAVTCTEPGCSGTGAFNFPAAANIADFQPDKYYNSEKLKSAAWTVPIAGVVTCGVNPQNVKVQVRDSVFHLTEESFSFNADCYAPVVTITEPPMFGNSWTNPQNPVIKGTASDDSEVSAVSLAIKDEVSGRYWNGAEWQATLALNPIAIFQSRTLSWEYDKLTKNDLNSGDFTIVAYAMDQFGRLGEAQATVGYKKRIDLGKKDFAGYTVNVKEVKNIARSIDTHSFITKSGEDIIGVTADIIPYRMSSTLSPYVKWEVLGANGISGNPFPTLAGNPARFYTRIPPIKSVDTGRGGPLGYTAFPRLEYDFKGVTIRYDSQDHKSVFQDNIDELRQEYVDLGTVRGAPERSAFDDESAEPYSGLLGGAAGDYSWHIIKTLKTHVKALADTLASPEGGIITLRVTSGYRTPKLNPGSKTSNHMYGEAFDYSQFNDSWDNFVVWNTARGTGTHENYLYEDSGKCFIDNQELISYNDFPDLPDVFTVYCYSKESGQYTSKQERTVNAFTLGHISWR